VFAVILGECLFYGQTDFFGDGASNTVRENAEMDFSGNGHLGHTDLDGDLLLGDTPFFKQILAIRRGDFGYFPSHDDLLLAI
jgi:hypothetical protein